MSKSVIETTIENLKKHVFEAGTLVEKAVHHACKAAIEKSEYEISQVLKFEEMINEHHRSLDDHCMQALAKLSPFGQDLRTIISVIKINSDLERMGDQSRNIVRIVRDQFEKVSIPNFKSFEQMVSDVNWMVQESKECFSQGNAQKAVQILAREEKVDEEKKQLTKELLEQMKSNPNQVKHCLDFILIVRNLERIADHCTNIAEETIFVTTGKDIRHRQEVLSKSKVKEE